jgi:hypothetical protein
MFSGSEKTLCDALRWCLPGLCDILEERTEADEDEKLQCKWDSMREPAYMPRIPAKNKRDAAAARQNFIAVAVMRRPHLSA